MPANNIKPTYEPTQAEIARMKRIIRDENGHNQSKHGMPCSGARQPSIHECKVGQ